MYRLNGCLEGVETLRLGDLDLVHEAVHQVLVDDKVRRREEGQDVLDERALVLRQAVLPVIDVALEIDLVDGPERGHGPLVDLPDVRVLDREQHVPSRVLQQRLDIPLPLVAQGSGYRARDLCGVDALVDEVIEGRVNARPIGGHGLELLEIFFTLCGFYEARQHIIDAIALFPSAVS